MQIINLFSKATGLLALQISAITYINDIPVKKKAN